MNEAAYLEPKISPGRKNEPKESYFEDLARGTLSCCCCCWLELVVINFFLSFFPEVSMNTISEIVGKRVQLKGLIGKRAVKCPYCNFYFMKNGSDLQRHIWAHEGNKGLK